MSNKLVIVDNCNNSVDIISLTDEQVKDCNESDIKIDELLKKLGYDPDICTTIITDNINYDGKLIQEWEYMLNI